MCNSQKARLRITGIVCKIVTLSHAIRSSHAGVGDDFHFFTCAKKTPTKNGKKVEGVGEIIDWILHLVGDGILYCYGLVVHNQKHGQAGGGRAGIPLVSSLPASFPSECVQAAAVVQMPRAW